MRVTRFEPYEVSLTSIPADAGARVVRSHATRRFPVNLRAATQGERITAIETRIMDQLRHGRIAA